MTAQSNAGQDIVRRARIAATLASEAGMPQYMLISARGLYLHESVKDGALTVNRAHAWRGTREKMRRVLDLVPERTRRQVRPVRVFTPQPAGRAS